MGGPPGDAFEVVYEKVTDKVRRNMHAADPVLAEYIRCGGFLAVPVLTAAFLQRACWADRSDAASVLPHCTRCRMLISFAASDVCQLCRLHLYGDIYSSPGVSMRQKQLLMAAFLAQANMHDQLFGHLIAVGLTSRCRFSCYAATDEACNDQLMSTLSGTCCLHAVNNLGQPDARCQSVLTVRWTFIFAGIPVRGARGRGAQGGGHGFRARTGAVL